MNASAIIDFWFNEIDQKLWFKKDQVFDQLLSERFGSIHQQAIMGELFSWRSTAQGRLAEIIVIDQFSRNLFRDSAKAFAYDSLALCLAKQAVELEVDKALSTTEKSFLYMPFMHSESAVIHQQAVKLFSQKGLEVNYEFELKHKAIIDRFGRYPHRNETLGRTSTPEEIKFLSQPGSSF